MSRWLAQLRVALRSILSRTRVEDELDEEMQFHLERQIDEGLRAGLAPEEARYAALRAMGAIGKSKEESRDLRTARFDQRLYKRSSVCGPCLAPKSGVRCPRNRHHGTRHRGQYGSFQRRQRRAAETTSVSRRRSYRDALHRFPDDRRESATGVDCELSGLARPELHFRSDGELPRRGISDDDGCRGRIWSWCQRRCAVLSRLRGAADHRAHVRARRTDSGQRAAGGLDQPRVLASPFRRRPGRLATDSARGQPSESHRGCHAGWLPLPGQDRSLDSADDKLHQPNGAQSLRCRADQRGRFTRTGTSGADYRLRPDSSSSIRRATKDAA